MTKSLLAAAGLLLSFACASTSAPTGTVTGIAVDGTGHGLPGITVSLQSPEGKLVQTVVTAVDGSFTFGDVPAGTYQLTTVFQGFTAAKPMTVTVVAGVTATPPPLVLVPPDMSGGTGS